MAPPKDTTLKVLYDIGDAARTNATGAVQRAVWRFADGLLQQALACAELEAGLIASAEYGETEREPAAARDGQVGTADAVATQALPRRVHSLYATAAVLSPLKRRMPAAWRVAREVARRAYGVPPPLPPVPAGQPRPPVDVVHGLFGQLPRREMYAARARAVTLYGCEPTYVPLCADGERGAAGKDSGNLEDTWIFALSEATKRDLVVAAKVDDDRVLLLTPSCSPATFCRERDPRALNAVRDILGLGRGGYLVGLTDPAPGWNAEHLVRRFCELLADVRLEQTSLVVCGPTSAALEEVVRRARRETGCTAPVLLAGQVSDANLAALYGGARAIILPAYADGGVLPLLEALQCGTPVISGTAPAALEVTGGAGIAVDPDDADALRRAMLLLLVNDEAYRRLSVAALERARAFSRERTLAAALRGYSAMLTRRPGT